MTAILDIGGGIRPQDIISGDTTVLEPHAEYREWLNANRPDVRVVAGEWVDAPRLFPPLSFDHVTILDVIEHLDHDEGARLLALTLPLARVSVTVFTPLGFQPQEPGEGGCDAWGLHGGEWQRHRSGWTPEDFPGWRILGDDREDIHPCFWAVWTRC
jgi:hypothetical protein